MPWIEARYDTKCRECGVPIRQGDRAFWTPEERSLYCDDNGCGSMMETERKTSHTIKPKLRVTSAYRCPDCGHFGADHNSHGCNLCPCLRVS